MLVLSRRTGEKIVIGDNIFITVIETKGGNVKLCVHAPRDVPVYREEIYSRIQDEKRGVRQPPRHAVLGARRVVNGNR